MSTPEAASPAPEPAPRDEALFDPVPEVTQHRTYDIDRIRQALQGTDVRERRRHEHDYVFPNPATNRRRALIEDVARQRREIQTIRDRRQLRDYGDGSVLKLWDNQGVPAVYLVAGLPGEFPTAEAALLASGCLLEKISGQQVSEIPHRHGQVWHEDLYSTTDLTVTVWRFSPCAALFPNRTLADEASRRYIAAIPWGAEAVTAILREIEEEVEERNRQVPMSSSEEREQRESRDLSWEPVRRYCVDLESSKAGSTLSADYNRAEARSDGKQMYYLASMMAVRGLLRQLTCDPTRRAEYDLADVFGKLAQYAVWISFPALDDLLRLHRMITARIGGTPLVERWSYDPCPALTDARKRLDEGSQEVYRRIRTEEGT